MTDTTTFMFVEFKEAFDLFDKNGDGFISRTELSVCVHYFGMSYSEEDLDAHIKEYDLDGKTYLLLHYNIDDRGIYTVIVLPIQHVNGGSNTDCETGSGESSVEWTGLTYRLTACQLNVQHAMATVNLS